MKIRKHISKIKLQRIVLFALVVLSAVLFDITHDSSKATDNTSSQEQTTHHQLEASEVIFYNPVSSFKFRTSFDKLFSKLLFSGTENGFLSQYHNFRTFHLLKAEAINKRLPFILTSNFMKFNFCHRSTSDDISNVF